MHCVEVPEESNHLICGAVSWTALKVRSLEQEQWRRQRGFSILYTQILKYMRKNYSYHICASEQQHCQAA